MMFARTLFAHRFARFLMAGSIAAGVNLVSRYFLSMTMEYRWAVIIAYLCGMITAWILARLFVFDETGRRRSAELARFGLVNMVAAAQVWFVAVGLVEYVFPAIGFRRHPEEVGHLIGVVIPIFTSYLGHKHFSFAPLKANVGKPKS